MRSLGPETPAPTRGEAGMASSLVSTLGWGPPERRHRAEIPDLISINPHGELPQSGATDFPGNFPGRRMPHPTSRRISQEIPKPGKPHWEFPGDLGIHRSIPIEMHFAGIPTGDFPETWMPHPTSREIARGSARGIPREIGCRIQAPGEFPGKSRSRETHRGIPRGNQARRPGFAFPRPFFRTAKPRNVKIDNSRIIGLRKSPKSQHREIQKSKISKYRHLKTQESRDIEITGGLDLEISGSRGIEISKYRHRAIV